MALKLKDKWLWDFWFAQDGSDYHVFYLQAPNTLEHESKRHFNVSIGHAISKDLKTWTVLPEALQPSHDDPNAFDNYTTWTGSIIKHKNLWYMFYTGSMKQEKGLIQRISLATSKDLIHWQKHSAAPLIEANPDYYELLDLESWHDQAWRDPWVFQNETGLFHAYVTARVKDGSADARGVIGHAVSENLIDWQVLPPVTEPGEFGQMEVPQLVYIGERYYLLFSAFHGHYSSTRKARGINLETGTHYLVADNPLGPFHYLTDTFLSGDKHGSLYSGKLIQDSKNNWQFLAFKNMTEDGQFIGELSDPIAVTVLADGHLKLERGKQ
jgi:beta-fructofuranosidase